MSTRACAAGRRRPRVAQSVPAVVQPRCEVCGLGMTGTRSFTLATKSSRTVMVLVQDLSGRAVLPLVPESGERELIAVGTREVVGLLAFWHLLPFAIRTTIFSCTLVAPCETFATCARALSPRQRFLSYFSSKLSRLTPPTIDVLVPIDVVGGFSETRFATRLRSSPVGGRHGDIVATKTPELPWLSICAAGQQSDCGG